MSQSTSTIAAGRHALLMAESDCDDRPKRDEGLMESVGGSSLHSKGLIRDWLDDWP